MKRLIQTVIAASFACLVIAPALGQVKSTPEPTMDPSEHARAEPVTYVTTRSEQLQAIRRAKMKSITPYTQGKLESGLLWVEETGLSLLSINVMGFSPRFGGLPTGAGFALGTNYMMPYQGPSAPDVHGTAAWTLRGYQMYGLQVGRIREAGASIYLDLNYRYFPQEDFFGLGPQSSVIDRTDFTFEQASYEGVVGYSLNSWLRLAGSAGVLQVNTGPGTDRRFPDTRELFDDRSAPGLGAQPDFLRLTTAVIADYRDTPGNPHSGGSLAAAFSRYEDWREDAYNFSRFELDARHYIPVGSSVRILALRFYTSSDQPDDGSRVPFYFQQTLGGGDALRGFREYRFRGRNHLYMSGEYRWEPVRAVEFALFYDAGKVFSRFGDFDFRGLRKSVGAGVRFKTSENTVFRVDGARSDEGTRLYLKFGRSF